MEMEKSPEDMEEEKKEEALIELQPKLMRKMFVGVDLLSYLQAAGVIDICAKEIIESKPTNHEKGATLLDHVKRDIKGRYVPFLQALSDTNQQHLVALIKLASTHGTYVQQPHQGDDPNIWMKQLTEKHKNISRTLPIFKDRKMSKKYIVDMTKLFTTLELIHGTELPDNDIGNEVTSLDEILDGTKRNIIFQGSPGCGKTSALLHTLTTSGEAMLKKDHCQQPAYKVMKDVISLVYVRPQDCKDSLDETVKSIFEYRCPEYKDQAYRHFKNQPEETGIIVDSLDEISSHSQLIEDVLKEMALNKRVILAGCRSHDPVIDPLIHAEHVTHVRVKGFEPRSISTYVEKYFLPDDDPSSSEFERNSEIIKAFEESLEDDGHLQGFLSNPMSLSLVCILVKDGKYNPSSLSGLTKIRIYSDIEELVLDREGLKLKEEKENLRAFHKYAFCAIVNNSGFFQEEMDNLGINVKNLPFVTIGDKDIKQVSKGSQVLWPHKSFSEYCAAKYVFECEKNKQGELLLFLAADRKLINTLIFILELLEPTDDLLTKIINYVLALQPDFKRPKHSLSFLASISLKFCHTTASETIQANISSTNGIKTLVENKKTIIKTPKKQLHPCSECWKKLNYASTVEGRAVIHNAQMCLQTCQIKDVRANIFTKTIAPLLLDRVDGGGLPLPVPNSDRSVHLREVANGQLVITANRPKDVVAARAYHTLGNNSFHSVTMFLEKTGGIFGEEDYVPTKEDWTVMLQDFMKNSPVLSGEGELCFKTKSEKLLLNLPNYLQDLSNHGVKNIVCKNGVGTLDSARISTTSFTNLGWQTILCDQYLHMSTKDWDAMCQNSFRYVDHVPMGVSLHFAPFSNALLQTLPGHLRVLSDLGVEMITINAEEHHIKNQTVSMKEIANQDWQVVCCNKDIFILPPKEWPTLLRQLPLVAANGSLYFYSYNDPLLKNLAIHLCNLMNFGVKQITIKAEEDQIKNPILEKMTNLGWQVMYGDGHIYLLSPKDWPQLMQDLIRNWSPRKEKATLYFVSYHETLLMILANQFKDLMQREVVDAHTPSRRDSLTGLLNHGWQTIDGLGFLSILSAGGLPQELKDLSKGPLHFLSESNYFLQDLAGHLQDLETYGIKLLMIKVGEEDIMLSEIDMSDIMKCDWQVIYTNGCLHINSPEIKQRVIPGCVRMIGVPGTSTRWVRAEKSTYSLAISTHEPVDIITSQALTVSTEECWSELNLHINRQGGWYPDATPPTNTPVDWGCLLEGIVSLSQHQTNGYGLEINLGEHLSPSQDEVSCYDYDNLLEVLPGQIDQLSAAGVKNIVICDGRVRGTNVQRFADELWRKWDLEGSITTWTGTGIFEQESVKKVMTLRLFTPVITVTRVGEQREIYETNQYTGLYWGAVWVAPA